MAKDIETISQADVGNFEDEIRVPGQGVTLGEFHASALADPESVKAADEVILDALDSTTKFLVLHITTSFGKRYTCRTVAELETFIDNRLAESRAKPANKNRKIRDEDIGIMIGFGRMTESEYAQVPACEYFIKPK